MRKIEMRLLTSICVIAVFNSLADLPVGDVAWLKERTSNGVSGDVIVVPTGEYKLNDTLTIAAGVTLKSATGNPDDVVFDGQGTVRCINSKANSVIESITVKNGYYDRTTNNGNGGGGILATGTLVTNCVIDSCLLESTRANTTGSGGAGIYATGASKIIGCTFTGNTYNGNQNGCGGGGLYIGDSETYVEKCRFVNNTINGMDSYWNGGGGLFVGAVGPVVKDCFFGRNNGKYGSSLYGLPSLVENCVFTESDRARIVLLVLFGQNGTEAHVKFKNCRFSKNVVDKVKDPDSQGLICLRRDNTETNHTFSFDNCVFEENDLAYTLIKNESSQWAATIKYVSNSVFRCNTLRGDAFYKFYENPIIHGCLFEGNKINDTSNLPLLYLTGNGLIENCKFITNEFHKTQTWLTHGVCISYGRLDSNRPKILAKIRNCLFAGNYAAQSMGVCLKARYYTDPDQISIDNCTFANNEQNTTHPSVGGMICISKSSIVRNCLFYNNRCGYGRTIHFGCGEDVTISEIYFNCCDAHDTKYQMSSAPDNNMFLDGTPEAVGFAKADPTIDYDYSLKKSSPLVDKGMALDWVVAKETLDINCEKKKYRLEGKSVDIGAYEYHPLLGLYFIMR